jgi:hypothetical protein
MGAKMKAILVIFLFTVIVQAQFEKKTFGINGNILFSAGQIHTKIVNTDMDVLETKREYTNFSLTPSASYFFLDNLSLGLLLTYNNSLKEYSMVGSPNDPSESSSRSILLGPELRYYFKYYQIYPFLLGSYQYGLTKDKYNPSASSEDSESYSLRVYRLGVGLSIFITEDVAVESIIAYTNAIEKSKSLPHDTRTESVQFEEDFFALGVGLNYYIK